MNIACVSYRDWALEIYDKLKLNFSGNHNFLIFRNKEEFDADQLINFNPDLILWYGWSWFVDDLFVDNYSSIMLHPSPLPKYRGGSPIQNQIINGEKKSAVTLFKMTRKLDDGDIYKQLPFSLVGSLDDIFKRIIALGYKATSEIINNDFILKKQNYSEATYFKRLLPVNSEITIEEIKNSSAEYLHNKIRMLNDPYPNAYIKTSDNKKLYLIKSRLDDDEK
tara:strand:- start:2934 stop:3599 length:666 start_codon:yes stop_codon:yes gene_type:complete